MYRAIWLARNRPGGLADSVARFQSLLAKLSRGANVGREKTRIRDFYISNLKFLIRHSSKESR